MSRTLKLVAAAVAAVLGGAVLYITGAAVYGSVQDLGSGLPEDCIRLPEDEERGALMPDPLHLPHCGADALAAEDYRKQQCGGIETTADFYIDIASRMLVRRCTDDKAQIRRWRNRYADIISGDTNPNLVGAVHGIRITRFPDGSGGIVGEGR